MASINQVILQSNSALVNGPDPTRYAGRTSTPYKPIYVIRESGGAGPVLIIAAAVAVYFIFIKG